MNNLPNVPNPPVKPTPSPLEVLDETARRNRVMFSGYQRIVHYLATSQECNPQDIKNIIADVMDQI